MADTPDFDRCVSTLTRRDFVKGSARTAAVAPIALGTLSGAATAAATALVHSAGSDTLRVGLIGCGGRGTGAASQAITADSGVVLRAMADLFPDRLESSLKNLGDKYPDERIMVDDDHRFVGLDAFKHLIDSDVDVIILATPPCFRPIHLHAAVSAGKHVFCEKPMAIDGPGVRSVLESADKAKENSTSLVSGFCWRRSDPERATMAEIHNGRIGQLRAMYTTYLTAPIWTKKRRPEWTDVEFQLRNWPHFTWFGGDHIVEQAVHSLDKMMWAFNGELPTRAVAVGGRMARHGEERGDVYDHFGVTYDFPNGARGFHSCRQIPGCFNDNTDYLMGTAGTCYINGWGPTHVIEGDNPWHYEGPRRNMYQNEHDEFFAAIRTGETINDGVWMAHSTLCAIMGRMAAYTGGAITWEQALNSAEILMPVDLLSGDLPTPPVAIPGRTKFS